MKARKLLSILNDTKYAITNQKDYIAVGSPLCHDLISVNKETLKLKYALDTFREGRKCLEGKGELLFIWDKLQGMIHSGEIKDIIEGVDELSVKLPVFTVEDGELIEAFTDKYGHPNLTDNGDLMYDNTHFPTKEQAIDYGIKECKYMVKHSIERINEAEEKLKEAQERKEKYEKQISHLNSLHEIKI